MSLDAVIFDWGGTLSIWADVDIEDMWRLAARHIAPDREEELTAALVAVEARAWARGTTDQSSARLSDLLAEASAELGMDVAGAMIEEAAEHHLDSWTPHIRHHADALPVLTAITDAGLKIGLLSNTHWPRRFHEHFLERDGLADLIAVRLYTSEMDHVKPHPSVYASALSALGVTDPDRAVFVGDRLYDDVWGSKTAGLRPVWVRNSATPAYDVEPAAVIDNLSELPAILDRWSRP
jgi:putative hydrolase of the HAD superfamily